MVSPSGNEAARNSILQNPAKHLSAMQGFAFQCLCSRLGIATGLNLAEHCGQEYPKLPRYLMWICMEIAIIGADIQEVIGSAIAIALLSNNVVPLWAGMFTQLRC